MGKAVPPADGEDDGRPLSRAQEARLDAALAEYRDRTFAQWAAPDGFSPDSPLGDRRISAAIRAARPPVLPRRRLRYSLTAVAAVVGVLAVTAALSTVRDAPGEPETGVLLAAATPGGDRGPFADGAALSRCLDAASVPALQRTLLGAGLVHVRGDRATVLLLPGGRLGDLRLLAVTPACARGEASSVLVDRVLTGDAAGRAATP
ncbi:hypothetical protein [Tsukamurella ocularis]|uniref:hypothetical protein n=1 Tax=Tsukamurella ocularis TaxID=1970234 RepID=UPI002169BD6B|nr:hypothetical protein [Tsukamurella ocularis]MCS3779278.1 hypothetical protein [Tsukamurella ocularis]MCS3787102.1 hypothetical protein [Tsukamurella ocularis]MCS3852493.1 hypothetical protein [Tsukamurella ocularis]